MKGNFQIISIVVFIAFAVFGILVFSGAIPIGQGNKVVATGTVYLWGTIPKNSIGPLIEDFNTANPSFTVKYEEKSADTFGQDLLEALASGEGPDLFFLSSDLAYHYLDKIYIVTYANYPLATFKNTYAGAAEVFLTSEGMLAFPVAVDPLVMYYNRSILDANDIVYPPSYWDEFSKMVVKITKKDNDNQLVKSAVAMGQFLNVTNAKDILTTLFMQAGNTIIRQEGTYFKSDLVPSNNNNLNKLNDLGPILSFYTNFSDPLKESYSWNKSLPYSQDFFSSEGLAFYFGFASEIKTLINKNPNQNLGVAPIPQIKNSNFKLTTSKVTGIAISKATKNLNTAFTAASLLASSDFAKRYAELLNISPARRDLLANKPTDSFNPTFYSSALFARSWLDPAPKDSNDIFRLMIEDVLSNNKKPKEAIDDADGRLNFLLIK